MGKEQETFRVRVDWYTRACLTVIAVLLTVLIAGLWSDYTPSADQARAERPARPAKAAKPFLDTSTQAEIVQLIRAQDRTTAKIGELLTLLRSGQLKVQVEDKGKGGADGPAKAGK